MRLILTLLLLFICNLSIQPLNAQGTVVDRSVPKDTIIKKDSTVVVQLNDLKAGFKDLFISDKNSEGLDVTTLNPRAISFVDDYIQKHKKKLIDMKGWGKPYFDMMDVILSQHGIPREMKYLAVIESHLK